MEVHKTLIKHYAALCTWCTKPATAHHQS